MDELQRLTQFGKFHLSPDRKIDGELTLSGAKTSLYLHDKDEFSTHALPDQYIRGVLHDLTKVSLIRCVTTSGPGYGSRRDEVYYFARMFPHFVIFGDSHIAPDEKMITQVRFAVDDATALFYDFDAFSFLIHPEPFIEQIVAANSQFCGRKIRTGTEPQILYFAGDRKIFAADTVLGKVSAYHNPMPTTLGGPDGVGLRNRIFVAIEFREPVFFEQCVDDTSTLLRFFEILAGRPQNILELDIGVEGSDRGFDLLTVYWSMRPEFQPNSESNERKSREVLMEAVKQPDDFSRVLVNWLERDVAWRNARMRFSNFLAEQNHYSIDRLIGDANMFDILPPSAVPTDVMLSDALEAAKEISRNAFLPLEPSPERHSVLGALGRMGKASLKHKIRARVAKIVDAIGERFPELAMVSDEAVNCRNFYVHGGDSRFDYNRHLDSVNFFIDTLEFVFAASDLIEAGWDAKSWSDTWTSMSHPFDRLRVNYKLQLAALKTLLPR